VPPDWPMSHALWGRQLPGPDGPRVVRVLTGIEKCPLRKGDRQPKTTPFLKNGFTLAFMLNGGLIWDACYGDNWKNPSRAFCRSKSDQGDLPGPWDIATDGMQGDPIPSLFPAPDYAPVRRSTSLYANIRSSWLRVSWPPI